MKKYKVTKISQWIKIQKIIIHEGIISDAPICENK